jgi:hypothetical protein
LSSTAGTLQSRIPELLEYACVLSVLSCVRTDLATGQSSVQGPQPNTRIFKYDFETQKTKGLGGIGLSYKRKEEEEEEEKKKKKRLL